MDRLRGRHALITGASGGLGGYIAASLAGEGVDLTLADRPASPPDELAERMRARGVRAEVAVADLADTASLEAFVDSVEDGLAPVDILVNNAALEFAQPYAEQTHAELEAIVSVNVLAVMELTRVLAGRMLARGAGHIVNLASLAGKVPTPYLVAYSATKHAVVGFTHSLRAELGPEPVGVSAICPGFISQVGMYGRLESEIPDVPRELGKLPPGRIGEAVVTAIRENRAEIIVNRRPVRPVVALAATAPGFTISRLLRRERNLAFGRRFAEARSRHQR